MRNPKRDLGWVTDLPKFARICHLSGGVASWAAARRVVDKYGTEEVILLFADTLFEADDTYRFLDACVKDLGARYVRLCEGRDPWEVFEERNFLSNSRVDHCSHYLKRELLDHWVDAHYLPKNVIHYFGFDWTETHRTARLQKYFKSPVMAPLQEPPYLEKDDIVRLAQERGLPISSAYQQGFSHDNCGGRCVKAGQAHYARLLTLRPETYTDVEQREQKLRNRLGNVSILRDRSNGTTKPLPLTEFRNRVDRGDFDKFDFGACSCFMNMEEMT